MNTYGAFSQYPFGRFFSLFAMHFHSIQFVLSYLFDDKSPITRTANKRSQSKILFDIGVEWKCSCVCVCARVFFVHPVPDVLYHYSCFKCTKH